MNVPINLLHCNFTKTIVDVLLLLMLHYYPLKEYIELNA